MSTTVTVNAGDSDPVTPGTFSVRAYYTGSPDAGNLYGPFASREAAERCATVLAARDNVIKVTIEEA